MLPVYQVAGWSVIYHEVDSKVDWLRQGVYQKVEERPTEPAFTSHRLKTYPLPLPTREEASTPLPSEGRGRRRGHVQGGLILQQLKRPGARHGQCTVVGIQFAKDGVDVGLDRANRDMELGGHRLIG